MVERFFDRGDEFVSHAHLDSTQVPGSGDRLRAEWFEFCQDTGLAVANTTGNRWVPRLLDLRRDGHFEVYDIAVPGLLVKRVELLSEMLLTCRGAMSEATVELRPGVYRVVLNFIELPDRLPFHVDEIPDSPDEVYFGTTALGEPLVWDTTEKFHAVIVGESGEGKTEAAALALTQLHLKGWEIVVLTPTADDEAFQPFADAGHTVIAGAEPDDITEARDVLEAQFAQVAFRERAKAASRQPVYRGQPSMLVIDESGDFLEDRKWEPQSIREDKQVIRSVVDQRARRGRKIRQHVMVITQEGYIHNFGTPETLRQLTFRLAVTGLDQTFQPIIFQRSTDEASANVRRILSNPRTPKGRGIARGGRPSTNTDYSVVDEIPVQVAHCPTNQRATLLGLNPSGLEVVA